LEDEVLFLHFTASGKEKYRKDFQVSLQEQDKEFGHFIINAILGE